jgi:glycogen operon protein
LGHTQSGNNNAYCQDNPTTWLRWTALTPSDARVADANQCTSGTDTHLDRHALSHFIAQLAALRRELPALRHGAWFSGTPAQGAAHPDIAWLDTDGLPMSASAWNDPSHRTLQAVVTVGEPGQVARERVLIIWHASHADVTCTLPPGNWVWRLDSSRPDLAAMTASGWLNLAEPAVCLLVQASSAPDAMLPATEPDTPRAPDASLAA